MPPPINSSRPKRGPAFAATAIDIIPKLVAQRLIRKDRDASNGAAFSEDIMGQP